MGMRAHRTLGRLAAVATAGALAGGPLSGGDAAAKVSAGEVKESGDSATATLAWTWPIAGGEWTYQTTARMTRGGDEWQVVWDPAVVEPDLAAGDRLDVTTIAARRGPILGARGARLVTERPVVRVGIDRGRVSERQAVASARRLAAGVRIDPGEYAKRVRAAGAKAFVEAIVYRRGELPRGLGGTQGLPGVLTLAAHLPLAPTKEFAAPILGRVGEVTA